VPGGGSETSSEAGKKTLARHLGPLTRRRETEIQAEGAGHLGEKKREMGPPIRQGISWSERGTPRREVNAGLVETKILLGGKK